MKKEILTLSVVAIVGLGSWIYLDSIEGGAADVEAPKPSDALVDLREVTQSDEPTIIPESTVPTEVPAVAEAADAAVTAPQPQPQTQAVTPDEEKLSDLEKEINAVMAGAHKVVDTYQRADADIEAKLDIQVRAALDRRAITAREVPEYRDYLRQIAIEDKSREKEDARSSRTPVSGIFADRSFVTEE